MRNRYDIDVPFDGKQTAVVDGIEYTISIEADTEHSIMDEQGEGVWCGRLEWGDRRTNDWGHKSRPEGFDGNASRLHFGRDNDDVWWQPPDDVKRGTEGFDTLRRTIIDCLEYGYVGVIVEDQFGHKHSCWGVEAMESDYHAEVACELIDDCIAQQRIMIGALA